MNFSAFKLPISAKLLYTFCADFPNNTAITRLFQSFMQKMFYLRDLLDIEKQFLANFKIKSQCSEYSTNECNILKEV